jgi:DNA end-binding protein Ku
MHGRAHLVGIKAKGKVLQLSILRYANEVRDAKPYFEEVSSEAKADAVGLAIELIDRMSGPFAPETMPDEYARAIQALVEAKVERRAPEVTVAHDGKPMPPVINIMDALKKSMQKQGQAKVRNAVKKRMAKTNLADRSRTSKTPERSATRSAFRR